MLTSVAARHSPLDPEKKDAIEVQTKYILSLRIEAKVSKADLLNMLHVRRGIQRDVVYLG